MIYQFKIELQHSDPLIWRRIKVNQNYRMDSFHQVIQIVMGWENSHLHEFLIDDKIVGMVDHAFVGELQPNEVEESTLILREFDFGKSDTFEYFYDFGAKWNHIVTVENFMPGDLFFPNCYDGEGACPPEDCGGIMAYNDICAILKNPDHPDHKNMLEVWPEDFKPDYFNSIAVNEELKRFATWHKKHPEERSTPWHSING